MSAKSSYSSETLSLVRKIRKANIRHFLYVIRMSGRAKMSADAAMERQVQEFELKKDDAVAELERERTNTIRERQQEAALVWGTPEKAGELEVRRKEIEREEIGRYANKIDKVKEAWDKKIQAVTAATSLNTTRLTKK